LSSFQKEKVRLLIIDVEIDDEVVLHSLILNFKRQKTTTTTKQQNNKKNKKNKKTNTHATSFF
jgi:hypothetical protein